MENEAPLADTLDHFQIASTLPAPKFFAIGTITRKNTGLVEHFYIGEPPALDSSVQKLQPTQET